MSSNSTELSDLNLIAVKNLKELVEKDEVLTQSWKAATLCLLESGAVPTSISVLEEECEKCSD